jgi:quercetin dioxygenase-like cupin family protein
MWDRTAPHDTRQALFGGVGAVRVWNLVANPLPPFAAVLACELEAGSSVGAHVQAYFPELVIAISGDGEVHVDGASRAFTSGAVIELPLGAELAIRNRSVENPLRYLIVKAAENPLG